MLDVYEDNERGDLVPRVLAPLPARVGGMVASPCGGKLALWCVRDVYVFCTKELRMELKLEGHEETVMAATFLRFRPHVLATAGDDRVVCLWDTVEVRLGGFGVTSSTCGGIGIDMDMYAGG